MINLRKQIYSVLKSYHGDVFFQQAPTGEDFPYVIYDFPNSFMNEEQEVFTMDVDVWDNQDDTSELETIASNVWIALNKYRYIDKDMQFSIYRDNRLPPLDEDEKNIKRRKLVFSVRYFDRTQ